MVIDRQVDIFTTAATRVDLAIGGDTVAKLVEAAQLLDVQVQHLAGLGALVAIDRWCRLQLGQSMQTAPAQQPGNGAGGYRQLLGNLTVGLA